MDFHDFPRILGKSGCVSHPPYQSCVHAYSCTIMQGAGRQAGHPMLHEVGELMDRVAMLGVA